MAVTPTNDFFGLEMLGMDPMAAFKEQRLNRLQGIDALLTGGKTPTPGAKPRPVKPQQQVQATASPVFGNVAQLASLNGQGGLYQPQTTYSGPAYNAGKFGGWDPNKWASGHDTPKYKIGRMLAGAPDTPEGLRGLLPEILKLDSDAELFGDNSDRILLPNLLRGMPGGDVVDLGVGFGEGGGRGWAWQVMNAIDPGGEMSAGGGPGETPGGPGGPGCGEGYTRVVTPGGRFRCIPNDQTPGDGEIPTGPGGPPKTPPGQDPPTSPGDPGNPNNPNNPNNPGNSFNTLYTDGNIPSDIRTLRAMLATFYRGNLDKSLPGYTGDLTVEESPFLGRMAQTGLAQEQLLQRALPALQSMFNFNAVPDLAAMDPALNRSLYGGPNLQGQPFMEAAAPTYGSLLRDGGAPDITKALEDIRLKGMMDIDDQLAQIREQYGSMGLAAGSDVNEALARGASRGIAEINRDQSSLATSILSDAAGRKLSATGMAPGMAASAAAPWESETQRILSTLPVLMERLVAPANAARDSAMVRGAGINSVPGLSATASAGGDAYSRVAALQQALQEGNIGRAYQDFIRQTTPAFLDSATAFATGFPSPVQKPTVDSGGGPMSTFLSILPLLFA